MSLIVLFILTMLSSISSFKIYVQPMLLKGLRENIRFATTKAPKGYLLSSNYVLDRSCLSGGVDTSKEFLVLGIESSCDDTAAAVVSSKGRVLSNEVISQYSLHERFGGIVPNLAKKGHEDNIDSVVDRALQRAGLQSAADVDAIAVTKGPGLEICLRVGYRKAQVKTHILATLDIARLLLKV